MKTLTRIALGATLALGALLFPTSEAMAQRGEKTLGIAGGFSTYNNGGYADVYFQYSFANHVRIAPEIGYAFRHDNKSAFIASIDMHFPFKIARGFSVYPLVGVTYNNWSYRGDGNASRAGLDFGGGFDIRLTNYLKLTVQGKYSLMNDTDGGFIGMGLGYVF